LGANNHTLLLRNTWQYISKQGLYLQSKPMLKGSCEDDNFYGTISEGWDSKQISFIFLSHVQRSLPESNLPDLNQVGNILPRKICNRLQSIDCFEE